MDDPKNKKAADAPFSGGGGAVDDLTPPTMQGVVPSPTLVGGTATQRMSSPPTAVNGTPDDSATPQATVEKEDELERTMVQPLPTAAGKALVISKSASPGASSFHASPTVGGHGAATMPGDMPTQDLSGEKLLRDAPRVESCGQFCPSLKGIPLLYKLGQGGMGAVYYGVHPRLRSEVAVKVLPFHLAQQDPGMIERFFREARIAAKVRSPHLVSVYDVDEESGLFFLVMEFVHGLTLGQYVKKQAEKGHVGIPELEAIDSVIAACMGLDAAHQNGVVHRDIKPDNIMVPYKSRTAKTFDLISSKLMDLGLARSEEGQQSLTNVSAAMGTPGYMAPEQAMDAKTADKRSDIFGMGATLYALLAGRPPFKGDVIMKVIMATMHEPHEPITTHRPDVTPGLAELIDRCLDKRPEFRPADARALIRALKVCRKVLSPDSVFGSEDEGGAEETRAEVARSHPHAAGIPAAASTKQMHATAPGGKLPAQPAPKSKLPLYAGIGAAALAVLGVIGWMVFGGKRPDVVVQQPGMLEPALSASDKKYILDDHKRALDAAHDYIDSKDFDAAEHKYQEEFLKEKSYPKQLADQLTELTALHTEIDSRRKSDRFDSLDSEIDVELKSNNPTRARELWEKLDPANPSQINRRAKRDGEIDKAEKKLKNKGEFNSVLFKSESEKLGIAERIKLVERALQLIPDEPIAVTRLKAYKEIQVKEQNLEKFKNQFQKALALYNDSQFEVAYTTLEEAMNLNPGDNDAGELKDRIFKRLDASKQQELQARSLRDAQDAYTKSLELSKADTANLDDLGKAMDLIKSALDKAPKNQAYAEQQNIVKLKINELKRIADLMRKKDAFASYLKDAESNLTEATDVKKVKLLDVALEHIHDARNLKLDDPNLINPQVPKDAADVKALFANLSALETKVGERKVDLETRKKYDDSLADSRRILDENDKLIDDAGNEATLAGINSGESKMEEALKILTAGKLVSEKEGVAAVELKKKLDAKKAEIEARDKKRGDVAAILAKGDDLLKNGKFTDAQKMYQSAEPAAAGLAMRETDAIQSKVKMAGMKIENLKKIDGLIAKADRMVSDEKFDDALATLGDAEKIMPESRLTMKRAEIDSARKNLDQLVAKAIESANNGLKAKNLVDAVQGLQKAAGEHPSRADLSAALNNLKAIQAAGEDITAKAAGLKSRYDSVANKSGGPGLSERLTVPGLFKQLAALSAATVDKLAASGVAGAEGELAEMNQRKTKLIDQITAGVTKLEGIVQAAEAAARAPANTTQQNNGNTPKIGEITPGGL